MSSSNSERSSKSSGKGGKVKKKKKMVVTKNLKAAPKGRTALSSNGSMEGSTMPDISPLSEQDTLVANSPLMMGDKAIALRSRKQNAAIPIWFSAIYSDFIAQERLQPTTAPIDPDTVKTVPLFQLTGEAHGADDVVEMLREVALQTPNSASRTFFNQLYAGREPLALLGELTAAMCNTSMYTYKAAGCQMVIEHTVLERMALAMGFDRHFSGTFTPGGSMSNFVAVMCARNEALGRTAEGLSWRVREEGVGAFGGQRLRVYTSALCHYSISKAAMMSGVGRDNIVPIDTDERGRMRVDALRAALEADKEAGHRPLLVVATAGTTVQGAFDPVDAVADAARDFGIWFHVDAAYGGTLVLSPTHKHLLKGVERADSITWDPHKLMGVPMVCSAILLRRRGALREHFDEVAAYLFQSNEEDDWLNSGRQSMQCGRRNDALKLWASWKHLGDAGYAARIDRQIGLAQYAVRIIRSQPDKYRLCKEPMMMNVCFAAHGVRADDLCDSLYQEGRVSVGWAFVDDEKVVRVVFINPHLTDADVDNFFAHLAAVADKLRANPKKEPKRFARQADRGQMLKPRPAHKKSPSPPARQQQPPPNAEQTAGNNLFAAAEVSRRQRPSPPQQ